MLLFARVCCVAGCVVRAVGLWGVRTVRGAHVPVALVSAFAGFRFPPEVIVLAVRW